MKKSFWKGTFFDLDPGESDFQTAQVVIIPAGYEGTVSYRKGTAKAPYAIFQASQQVELYEPELGLEPCQSGIATHPPLELEALKVNQAIVEVEKAIEKVLQAGKKPVLLGGEHSLSLGVIKALKRFFPEFSLLVLDAHADLRDSYLGEKFSHACVMKRILEQGVKPVWVGVRSLSKQEAQLIKEKNLEVYFAHQLSPGSGWEIKIAKTLGEIFYLSLDLDVFDPSQVPGVGTPEPAGMFYSQVLSLLKALAKEGKNLIGFDLVELAPIEGEVVSEFTTARLLYQIIGWFWSRALFKKSL